MVVFEEFAESSPRLPLILPPVVVEAGLVPLLARACLMTVAWKRDDHVCWSDCKVALHHLFLKILHTVRCTQWPELRGVLTLEWAVSTRMWMD